jgi:hypothetical protein
MGRGQGRISSLIFTWSKLQGMKPKSPREVPQEYTAFKNLLRQVVKVEPKPKAKTAS